MNTGRAAGNQRLSVELTLTPSHPTVDTSNMRKRHLWAALLIGGLVGAGAVYAQPDQPSGENLPDVTASGETQADLSPREMATETERLLKEMEAMHVRVLQLQTSARKAKDVIKLNCVNEKLLAVKQLLNIGEAAQTDLTESIAGGDRAGQVHNYGQVKLAHERVVAERDEAEGCIGEEIVFVGPTKVDVTGPDMPDDPTDDPDVDGSFWPVDPFDVERPNAASPWY